MSSSPQSNRERFDTFFALAGADELGAASYYLHNDFVVSVPDSVPWGGEWRGREGWLTMFGTMQEAVEFQGSGEAEFLEGPDTLAMIFTVTYTSRTTRTSHKTRVTEIFKFRDGLIVHTDVFFKDTDKMVADLEF
jgi:hypothetical protein